MSDPIDHLIFHVDFSGKGGSTDNIVYDTVNNLPCTLVNVLHDGTEGWLDDQGLVLKPGGGTCVRLPVNDSAVYNEITVGTDGITFVYTSYDIINSVMFRNDSPVSLWSYVGGIVAATTVQYNGTDATVKTGGFSSTQFRLTDGGAVVGTQESANPATELNMVTVRIFPDGKGDIFINQRYCSQTTLPSFQSYRDWFAAPLFLRLNYVAVNQGHAKIRGFKIYNRTLTKEEILEEYETLKTEEPLTDVNVYPSSPTMMLAETKRVVPVAIPSRYTELLANTLTSGNTGIVAATQNGMLTGVGAGPTTVGVASFYNGQTFHNTVNATVITSPVNPPTSTRTVTGISLNRIIDSLPVGHSFSAMATTLPFDVFDDNIVYWYSSDPQVCTVTYGVLTGVEAGTSTITATDGTGVYTANFTVNVYEPVEDIITPAETYVVNPDDYGISIVNTNSSATTAGIQNALNYASSNGFKKIVFPLGTYRVSPAAGTISLPTEMVVDFSDSMIHIELSSMTSTGYTMFKMDYVSNTKLMNAHIYGEADTTTVSGSAEGCQSMVVTEAENSGLENCTFSKSPGFNISCGIRLVKTGTTGTSVSKDSFEAGSIDASGANDNSVTSGHWRSNGFLNVSGLGDYYLLGYTQGYQGYPYLRSRLYSIFLYDNSHNFIGSQMYNLQYYNYDKPAGAHYAKIVIYQETKPTAQDTDFNAVAFLRTTGMPRNCFIRGCTFEDCFSSGLNLSGGESWLVEGNSFARNGRRMPACDLVSEDGWETMNGYIVRNNVFNSDSGVIATSGSSLVYYGNVFNKSHMNIWSRSNNFRIFNNFYDEKAGTRKVTLAAQAESYFCNNILKRTDYTLALNHTGANYRIRDYDNVLL